MTLGDIKKCLNKCRPVICSFQAWGGAEETYEKNLNGHYAVLVGYDKKCLYFSDPSIEGFHGFLTFDEFVKRWHDVGIDKEQITHMGIVIWRTGVPQCMAVKID